MARVLVAAPVLLALLVLGGCMGAKQKPLYLDQGKPAPPIRFVPAPRGLIADCHATARVVGYAVPCPTRVPFGLAGSGLAGPTGCALPVIGAGGLGDCARSWRMWVVGSSYAGREHLVISASPRPLERYAKVVNGPAWYRGERVRPLRWLTINGWRIRAVYVPPPTNDGSAFMHHVVLIWTTRGHTYAVGFHDFHGLEHTLRLDEELARGLRLVGP